MSKPVITIEIANQIRSEHIPRVVTFSQLATKYGIPKYTIRDIICYNAYSPKKKKTNSNRARDGIPADRMWSDDEVEFLISMLGTHTIPEMTEGFSREFQKHRGEGSLRAKAACLGYSIYAPDLNLMQIGTMMGVHISTVQRWTKRGWITGKRASKTSHAQYCITYDDLCKFIRAMPQAYKWQKIKHKGLRALGEVTWRTARLITTAEAAKIIGIARNDVLYHGRVGNLNKIRGAGITYYYKLSEVQEYAAKRDKRGRIAS